MSPVASTRPDLLCGELLEVADGKVGEQRQDGGEEVVGPGGHVPGHGSLEQALDKRLLLRGLHHRAVLPDRQQPGATSRGQQSTQHSYFLLELHMKFATWLITLLWCQVMQCAPVFSAIHSVVVSVVMTLMVMLCHGAWQLHPMQV